MKQNYVLQLKADMEFMDFFVAYLENSIRDIEAESGIKCQLPQLASANKTKDYAKAVICLTYFKRYVRP